MSGDEYRDKEVTATILAIGDVHLGTRPASVPADDRDIDISQLTPEAALIQAIDYAVDQKVDAVLFAGDVVENKNARYEALRPLEKCIEKLQENSIKIIGVAGNHDIEALPRLAKLLPGFKLLGAGGTWESLKLSKKGVDFAEIVGWSFGQRKVAESPVKRLLAGGSIQLDEKTVPRIGLLHCDLGAVTSNYAPVSTAELKESRFDLWLLGHIHKPSLKENQDGPMNGSFGYLGSLVGLDPSESGDHGPWIISFKGSQRPTFKQVLHAPLRWENIDVSLDGLDDVDDVWEIISSAIEELTLSFSDDESRRPKVVGIRVSLTGAPKVYEEVRKKVEEGEWLAMSRRSNGIVVFVNKIYDQMELEYDLEDLARGDDPPGLLAKKILALKQGGEDAAVLINGAREALEEFSNRARWRPLDEHRNAIDPLDDEAIKEVLDTAARTALSRMIALREDERGVS